jgi:hypothetical protein
LEPGNLEKNKKLFAPIEENLKKLLSRGGKSFPKFEITDTQLSIAILMIAPKRKLPP